MGEFFLPLWWLFKPCLNHCNRDLFDFHRSTSESMDAAYVLLTHSCEYPAWSFSSVTVAFLFYNTVHSISFYAVNRSYSNFFQFYIVFLPFSEQHSGVQSLLFSWHTFAGQQCSLPSLIFHFSLTFLLVLDPSLVTSLCTCLRHLMIPLCHHKALMGTNNVSSSGHS